MPDTSETYRSFTVRVPLSMYLRMGELAKKDDSNLNQKVNQLLKLGMGEHVSLDSALLALLRERVVTEEKKND